jgi:hypothetical protein
MSTHDEDFKRSISSMLSDHEKDAIHTVSILFTFQTTDPTLGGELLRLLPFSTLKCKKYYFSSNFFAFSSMLYSDQIQH